MSDSMDAEFDTVAEWTGQVAQSLGPDYYLPAGCRGSGGPRALDAILHRLAVGESDRMLDVGAGVGGPAGYAHLTTGVRPVLVEPQAGACRAARRLFDLPVARGDGLSLPFAHGTFDVVWSLGVLCTTRHHRAALAELRRVVADRGRVGLLVYIADGALPESPEGNHFPTTEELHADLAAAGLAVADERDLTSPEDETQQWRDRADTVDRELTVRHRHEATWQQAESQSSTMGRLLAGRHLAARVLILRPHAAKSDS